MEIETIGELELISSNKPLAYVPICNSKGGYVTELGASSLKLETFNFSVAKATCEILTIEPYFIDKTFTVLYGACLNEEILSSYGGVATEIAHIKFTGESLDNFTAFLQDLKKEAYIATKASGKTISQELEQVFVKNLLSVSFTPKFNKKRDRYYACEFALLATPFPKFTKELRDVYGSIKPPADIVRLRSPNVLALNQSQDARAASSSASSRTRTDESSDDDNEIVGRYDLMDADYYPF